MKERQCPECKQWAADADWLEEDEADWCSDCNDWHHAFECPHCKALSGGPISGKYRNSRDAKP